MFYPRTSEAQMSIGPGWLTKANNPHPSGEGFPGIHKKVFQSIRDLAAQLSSNSLLPGPVPVQASSDLHSRFLNAAYFLGRDKVSRRQVGLHTSRRHTDHRHYVAFQLPPWDRCVSWSWPNAASMVKASPVMLRKTLPTRAWRSSYLKSSSVWRYAQSNFPTHNQPPNCPALATSAIALRAFCMRKPAYYQIQR